MATEKKIQLPVGARLKKLISDPDMTELIVNCPLNNISKGNWSDLIAKKYGYFRQRCLKSGSFILTAGLCRVSLGCSIVLTDSRQNFFEHT